MNLSDYLVILAAMLNLLAETRDTYYRWRNYEPPEMTFLRKEMLRNGAEAERLRLERDKWVRDATELHVEIEDMRKKIEHLRRQIPPAKLLEIDDSFHGERL